MSIIAGLENIAGTRIFNRGMRYYEEGRIRDFEVYVRKLPGKRDYSIQAVVMGTHPYDVKAEIVVTERGVEIEEVYCTCPFYDRSPFCKHVVAVVYKFLLERFQEIRDYSRTRFKELNYGKLKNLISQQKQPEVELLYRVKGLLTNSMVNFRLTLESENLSKNEMEDLMRYMRREWPYHESCPIGSRLSFRDITAVEFLRREETRRSAVENSVLIYKTAENFSFICSLIQQGQVILEEKGVKAELGEAISIPLTITGDEEEIVVGMKPVDFEIYSNDYTEVAWTVIGNRVHPVDLRRDLELPLEIAIPEEKKGEFIFEIIPELEHRLKAEVRLDIPDYRLIVREPLIRLNFDYKDNEIRCQVEAVIGDKVVEGIKLLEPKLREDTYRRSKEDELVWYKEDRRQLRRLVKFLEENEFLLRGNKFVIKDHSGIQNFITGGFLRIPEEWEVNTTPAFDELDVAAVTLEPIVELDTRGIDWFEFNITYNLGGKTYTRDELLKMLRTNSRGENYIHTGNTYYVIQEEDSEKDVVNRLLELSEKGKGNSYRSRFYNLLYYHELFKRHGIEVKGDAVYNHLKEDISRQHVVREVDVPPEVKGVLRKYQLQGYYWLRFLNKYRFGGILADDMGLGKTLQALTLLKSTYTGKPSLVVCPRTLIYNWADEIEKFYPGTAYLVYHGTPDARETMRKSFGEKEVIIASYDTVSRDVDELAAWDFYYCILDEAQHIKNHRTKRARNLKKLRAEHRLALTGTPIENSVSELWSVFDFLMPGYLGSYREFKTKYQTPINRDGNGEKLAELKERVAPFILRRTKEQVLKELPEKVELVHRVYMTKLQEDTYRTILEQTRTEVFDAVRQKGFERARIHVLAALTKLRQVCNHPGLVLDNVDKKTSSGKLEGLMEIVEEAIAGGHKIIVFSQFVRMLKLIEERFKQAGISYEYLDGSIRNRMGRVRRFNEDESISAFLISLKAGGTGLNLTAADTVVHVDPWWNPMVEKQATDRAHRIGQDKRVVTYKLITAGTIEEKMLKLQQKKQSIFNTVIEENKNPVFHLTWEDIKELFEWEN